MVLRLSGVTKTYGRLTALDDVSLSVRSGEVLGLIGPNGAGKTTLFECLAGLLPIDRGAVTLDNRAIGVSDRARHLFYMPDGIAPWSSQRLAWVLDFTIAFFEGDAARRNDVVRRLALEPLLGSEIGRLSKGQRKRALLAVGMLTPHPFLLIDEPFDGLDLRQSHEVGAALRDHAAAGRTLFLSIHQIHDAARFCDRFVLLSGGRVRGEGTLDELSTQTRQPDHGGPPDLEQVFLALT